MNNPANGMKATITYNKKNGQILVAMYPTPDIDSYAAPYYELRSTLHCVQIISSETGDAIAEVANIESAIVTVFKRCQ